MKEVKTCEEVCPRGAGRKEGAGQEAEGSLQPVYLEVMEDVNAFLEIMRRS